MPEPSHQLTIANGRFRGHNFELHEGSNLVGRWDPIVGSFPEVDLDSYDHEARVSRKHAVIRSEAGQVSIEDLGSKNGTFVNQGQRLPAGEVYILQPGDTIHVGPLTLSYQAAAGADSLHTSTFDRVIEPLPSFRL